MILFLNIKGFKSFWNEMKNPKKDKNHNFIQKSSDVTIFPTTTTTTKEKEQITPKYKTLPKKEISTTDFNKTITEKTDDSVKKIEQVGN